MQFNEFQRRLKNASLSPEAKYLFSHMFETQIALSKQVDEAVGLVLKLAESMAGFVKLHESTQGKVKQLMEYGRVDGVDVQSVTHDPETEQ